MFIEVLIRPNFRLEEHFRFRLRVLTLASRLRSLRKLGIVKCLPC